MGNETPVTGQKANPVGLPNGNNAADYSTKPRSASAWRWEFLRRREDYQSDWASVYRDWQRRKVRECANIPLPPGVLSWRKHFADIAGLPRDAQRQKYGVAHLKNPAMEWDPYRFSGTFLRRAEQLRDAARGTVVPSFLQGYEHRFQASAIERMDIQDALRKGNIITVHIDLQQPLGPQIDHIKLWLMKAQAELPKLLVSNRRESEWRLYLRILDLNRSGRDLKAIAACVYPSDTNTYETDFKATKKARKALKRARHLQDTLALGR